MFHKFKAPPSPKNYNHIIMGELAHKKAQPRRKCNKAIFGVKRTKILYVSVNAAVAFDWEILLF